MPQDNKARALRAAAPNDGAPPLAARAATIWIRAARFAPARLWCLTLLLLLAAGPVRAIELCGDKSRELMRSAGISADQIARLCELEAEASKLTRLSIRRTEDENGYCRVTLALKNDSIHHINTFALTSGNGRYEIFQFFDIIAGATGYASAASRSLMSCDEVPELKIALRWPGSVRADDHPLQGRQLDQFKPALASKDLKWIE
jgi:hypothetical protein